MYTRLFVMGGVIVITVKVRMGLHWRTQNGLSNRNTQGLICLLLMVGSNVLLGYGTQSWH